MVVNKSLRLTADRQIVVLENDKRAVFRFAAKGQEIPNIIAKQYGLLEKKKAKKPANKMMAESENKAIEGADNG